jgi:hypothetical protein
MEPTLQSDVLERLERDPALQDKARELAGSVAFTWGALSSACHHPTYELAPTAQGLSLWAETAERLMAATK